MTHRRIVACLLVLVAATVSLLANGSKGKRLTYEGTARVGEGSGAGCKFLVELEPVLFQITSVQSKYRVLRINIRNEGAAALRLSLEKDSVQVRSGSRLLSGILDLGGADPAWWDKLSPDLRKALAYPDQSSIQKGEEENVFVFVPVSDLTEPPEEILFKIESVSPAPISLRQRGVSRA